MANTITEGLQDMAQTNLSGLNDRLRRLREEAEKQIQGIAETSKSHELFIAALKRAKEVSL